MNSSTSNYLDLSDTSVAQMINNWTMINLLNKVEDKFGYLAMT